MKKIAFLAVLVLTLTAGYSFADRDDHMMGGHMGSPGYGQSQKSGEYGGPYGMMGPGMMGGYGMGPGMMGGYGMNPGMMGYGGCDMMHYGGYGMMGPGMMGHMRGMMGPGMMGGYGMNPGMMGGYGMGPGMMGYGSGDYQKFLDDTRGLRRDLNNKRFEYMEAARKPETKREDLEKIQKEIWELQEKIGKKWRK